MAIGRKLTLIILTILIVAMAIVFAGILIQDRSSSTKVLTRNLSTLADVIGTNSKAALSFEDADSAQRILSALAAEPEIELAGIYTGSNRLLASYRRADRAEATIPPPSSDQQAQRVANRVLISRRIELDDQLIGTVVIQSGLESLRKRQREFLGIAGLALFVSIVFGLVVSKFLIKGVVSSLNQAMTVAKKVAQGDLTGQVEEPSRDEVGQLIGAIRTMTQNLNSLIGNVKRTCIQVTSSTNQIGAFSKDLEATATQQATATNQVVSTAREISATSQELVNTMSQVAITSAETAESAQGGQQGLLRMEAVMQQLERATVGIAAKLAAINQKAAEINSVVTTITKVADQTNLLSLNAAIEAEKAGEYGLGFGVVAREIRRLADQTAVATLDIEKVVNEMRSAVGAGVMGMEKFSDEVQKGVDEVRIVGTQFASIIERVQALTPQFESVSSGMEAQSQGAQQISDSMTQLSEAATHTADSVRDTNQTINDLKNAAANLQKEISHFKMV